METATKALQKSTVNAHKETEDKLLSIIADCLVTGKKLPTEKQMAQQCCVGRTILRETLHSFEALGLISSQQGSGWYAKTPDFSQQIVTAWMTFIRVKPSLMLDLWEIRNILETSSLELAVNMITSDELQEMGLQVSQMIEKAKRGEPFVQEDRKFHLILFSCTKNIFLEQLLIAFWDIFENSPMNKAHEDLLETALGHQEFLEAILHKDIDTLRRSSSTLAADAKYRILMEIASQPAASH